MSNEGIAAFVVGLFAIALILVLFAPQLVVIFKSVRGLRRARRILGPANLENGVLAGDSIIVMCNRVLHDLLTPQTLTGQIVEFEHRRMGDVVEIVYYRERSLKRVIKELRWYAFLVLALGLGGLFYTSPGLKFARSWLEAWEQLVKHPAVAIAWVEGVMLLFCFIRLAVEVNSIDDLVDDL